MQNLAFDDTWTERQAQQLLNMDIVDAAKSDPTQQHILQLETSLQQLFQKGSARLAFAEQQDEAQPLHRCL